MEVKGRVIQSLGIQKGVTKAGKEWSKATIIIETEGQYPKKIALENLKKAEEFSNIPVGTEGVFHIEISSNEFNGRWYTSIGCWKWVLTSAASQPAQSTQSATPTLDEMGVTGYKETQKAAPAEDDLPF